MSLRIDSVGRAEALKCTDATYPERDRRPRPEPELTNRFANLGYVALGVDLYTRDGGPPPMDDKGAGHAFFADYRPSYRPEPAARLWEQVVPFFARHLQGH